MLVLIFFAYWVKSIDPVVNGDTLEFTSPDQFVLPSTIRELVSKHITKIVIKNGTIDNITSSPWFYLVRSIDIRSPAVNSIPSKCFKDTYFLKKVILSSNIKKIESEAFNYSGIEEINLENVEIFESNCFSYTTYLRHVDISGAKTLSDHCFFSSGLIELTIPDQINTLDEYFASKCSALTTVTANNLTYIGSLAFAFCQNLTNLNFNFDVIEEIGYRAFSYVPIKSFPIGKNLRDIYAEAFQYSAIESIFIPENAQIRGYIIFDFCCKLKKLTILAKLDEPGSYQGCYNLEEVILPDTVKEISHRAFKDCHKIVQLNLQNVETIYYYSFQNCYSLSLVHLPKITSIQSKAFFNCPNVYFTGIEGREDEISFYKDSFEGCDKLNFNYLSLNMTKSTFRFCKGLKSLKIALNSDHPDQMLIGCLNLEEVVFTEQSTATKINRWMFTGCKKLKRVVLPSSITSIGEFAFFSTNLETFDLKNVNKIEESAFTRSKLSKLIINNDFEPNGQFSDCYNLNTVVLGENVRNFTLKPFMNCNISTFEVHGNNYLFDNGVLYDPTKTTLVCVNTHDELFTIPQQITRICYGAFSNYAKIKKIVLNQWFNFAGGEFANTRHLKTFVFNSKTDFIIQDYMFCNCTNLETLKLSSNILTIGKYAFAACEKLIELGNTDDNAFIDDYAFANCTSLKRINISHVLVINQYAFYKCTNLTEIHFSENILFIREFAFAKSGLKEIVLRNSYNFEMSAFVFKDCNDLKKVYLYCQTANKVRPLFIDAKSIEYLYIGKDVYFYKEFFWGLNQNIKIEIDPENPNYGMRGNALYYKDTEKVLMYTSNSKDIVELSNQFADYTDCYISTSCDIDKYDNSPLLYTTMGPSTLKIPASTKYTNVAHDSKSLFLFTICYDGEYFLENEYNMMELRRFITNGNYPYPTALDIPVEYGECESWTPVQQKPDASVNNNVFGLTKKETFLIIVVAIVSAALIAFVIYFSIKWRRKCLKKKANASQNPRDNDYADEVVISA